MANVTVKVTAYIPVQRDWGEQAHVTRDVTVYEYDGDMSASTAKAVALTHIRAIKLRWSKKSNRAGGTGYPYQLQWAIIQDGLTIEGGNDGMG